MNRAQIGILAAGLLVAAAGCERNEPVSNQPAPSTSRAPGDTSGGGVQGESHQQAFIAWRHQLDDFKSKVDQLRTKAASTTGDMKDDFTDAVHDLDNQIDKIQNKLNGYQPSKDWNGYKEDVEKMFSDLSVDLHDAQVKYGNVAPESGNGTPPTTTPNQNQPGQTQPNQTEPKPTPPVPPPSNTPSPAPTPSPKTNPGGG